MRGWRRCAVGAVGAVVLGAYGCAGPDEGGDQPVAEAGGGSVIQTPALFGFGTPATEARIALWDKDVGPDGVGLPGGEGTPAEGERVYMTWCVSCHGPTGSEGPNDQLIGGEPWGDGYAPRPRTVGNYWPYATTLFDYITRAMPQNAPGSLSADDTYAVIAWLLAQNGIVERDVVLNSNTLPQVVMPARDRFVVDNRIGGGEVR